jgi:steroid delta-isomerase-like uncharacterized protein
MAIRQLRPDEMVAAVERDLEEVWTRGDLDVIDELYAEDCAVYGPIAGEAIHGCEAMKEAVGKAREAFPDLEIWMEDSVAADDKVAVRYAWSGTNEGPLPNGTPATGERVTVPGIGFVRFEGDRFAELHFYNDFEDMMGQLGLMPESM